MDHRKRAGRFRALARASTVYLIVTPLLVLAVYAPLLLGRANLFHYLNEAICLWLALFLAPFAVIERALAGWSSLRATTSLLTRR